MAEQRNLVETVHLAISADVLERLIASGELCAAEVCCNSARDTARLSAICKRCCMKRAYSISSLRPSSTSRI